MSLEHGLSLGIAVSASAEARLDVTCGEVPAFVQVV